MTTDHRKHRGLGWPWFLLGFPVMIAGLVAVAAAGPSGGLWAAILFYAGAAAAVVGFVSLIVAIVLLMRDRANSPWEQSELYKMPPHAGPM